MNLRPHLSVLLLLALAAPAADEAGQAQIRQRVALLDDDQFVNREAAKAQLLEIGEPAIPLLLAAIEGGSPEQRTRATAVVRAIRLRSIARGFAELGRQNDDAVEVEQGMCLIAQMIDPGVTAESIAAKLDEMAAALRETIGKGTDPQSLSGSEVMVALTGVLEGGYGLHGDTENYNHPDNSSIHRVIEQKDGLPILLSEIAVAVAQRLDLPVVGIPVPGRYMIKYDGAQAPQGQPHADVIVDPYGGWKVLTAQEIKLAARTFDPDSYLVPSTPRATLERMLNNLEADFEAVGERGQAAAARKFRALLDPGGG